MISELAGLDLDPRTVANISINLFGAAGAGIVAVGIQSASPHSPIAIRIRGALWLVAALFFTRCIAWSSGAGALVTLTQLIGATMPIAGLVVAEGLMRRHAPGTVKVAVSCCTLAAFLVLLAPGLPVQWSGVISLLALTVGFVLVAATLVLRDRQTLNPGENATIDRTLFAMVILLPAIATDFPSVLSEAPARLGALGTLVFLFLAFAPSGSSLRISERALSLLVFFGIGFVFSTGYILSAGSQDAGQLTRAASVGLSGLIVAALLFEVIGARAERRKSSPPMLQATTLQEFLSGLEGHEAIGDLTRLGEAQLAPLAHPRFIHLFADNPVLSISAAPWGVGHDDPGAERALSLLKTYDATHVLRLSIRPLELVVFQIPPSAVDARLESEIKVAQRIGQLLFRQAASVEGGKPVGATR